MDDRGALGRVRYLRLWHLLVVIIVIGTAELLSGLPGLWFVVAYGGGLILAGVIVYAVTEREGGSVGDRRDFTHGRDMHGHYR